MTDYTRQLAADVDSPTTVDNNIKAEGGAEPPMVQIAARGDEYGNTIANWTGMTGTEIWNSWPNAGGGSIAESSGVQDYNCGGNVSMLGMRHDDSFDDCDVAIYVSSIDAAVHASSASIAFKLWRILNNLVYIVYFAKNPAGAQKVGVYKVINGALTNLALSADLGSQSDIWFRIKRVASTQTFTFYYATADPDVGGWTELYSGVINDATHFNSGHVLYPIHAAYTGFNTGCNPNIDWYRQTSGSEERRWPDSPEANIIDSANCGVGETYAFDAGADNTWALTGASSVEDGDGGTNKWKVGYSDAADGTGVSWDAGWLTIGEVNTNASNGNYNGHRYLYVKWQGNGDGLQFVNATSFTISGAAAEPPDPDFSERHANSLQITVGGVECRSLVSVGAIPGVAVIDAAGRNGPGAGLLRSTGDGTYLSWKAPGSSTWGTSVHCGADGIYLLEDGDDRDSWIRVHVFVSFLSPGPVSARIYTRDIYENDISYDDVTAGEASAGDVTDYEVTLTNVTTAILSQVKAWLDAGVTGLEISDDDITYVSPTTESTALEMADIPALSGVTFYLRRTIGAAKSSDADVLNHLKFSWAGI